MKIFKGCISGLGALGFLAWLVLIWEFLRISLNWIQLGIEFNRNKKKFGDGIKFGYQSFGEYFRAKCILFEVIKDIKSKETNILIRVLSICFLIGMPVFIFILIFP